jgi:hypothetical protein
MRVNGGENMGETDLVLVIRVIQSILFGVFILGVSMSIGDLMPYAKLPISPMSATTMTYGALGMIVCEYLARRFESWQKKTKQDTIGFFRWHVV